MSAICRNKPVSTHLLSAQLPFPQRKALLPATCGFFFFFFLGGGAVCAGITCFSELCVVSFSVTFTVRF